MSFIKVFKYFFIPAVFIFCFSLLVSSYLSYTSPNLYENHTFWGRIVSRANLLNLIITPEQLKKRYNLQTALSGTLFSKMEGLTFMHFGHTKDYGTMDIGRFPMFIEEFPTYEDVLKHFSPDFIISTGDFVFDPFRLNHWQVQFFEKFKSFKKPIFSSPGNHENYDEFMNYKALIRENLWYSFYIEDICFISIAYSTIDTEQETWLNQILSSEEKIIIFSGSQDQHYRNIYANHANAKNIKLVISGDGHKYQNTFIKHIPNLIANDMIIRRFSFLKDGKLSWESYFLGSDRVDWRTPLDQGTIDLN